MTGEDIGAIVPFGVFVASDAVGPDVSLLFPPICVEGANVPFTTDEGTIVSLSAPTDDGGLVGTSPLPVVVGAKVSPPKRELGANVLELPGEVVVFLRPGDNVGIDPIAGAEGPDTGAKESPGALVRSEGAVAEGATPGLLVDPGDKVPFERTMGGNVVADGVAGSGATVFDEDGATKVGANGPVGGFASGADVVAFGNIFVGAVEKGGIASGIDDDPFIEGPATEGVATGNAFGADGAKGAVTLDGSPTGADVGADGGFTVVGPDGGITEVGGRRAEGAVPLDKVGATTLEGAPTGIDSGVDGGFTVVGDAGGITAVGPKGGFTAVGIDGGITPVGTDGGFTAVGPKGGFTVVGAVILGVGAVPPVGAVELVNDGAFDTVGPPTGAVGKVALPDGGFTDGGAAIGAVGVELLEVGPSTGACVELRSGGGSSWRSSINWSTSTFVSDQRLR